MVKKRFIIFNLVLMICVTMALSGCNIGYGREFERVVVGDFIVIDFSDYEQELYIEGLSEEGKEKTVIVVPEYLRGKKVTGFNHTISNNGPGDSYWRSSKLEKVFIVPNYTGSAYVMDDMKCEHLRRVIIINQEINHHTHMYATTYYSKNWYEHNENVAVTWSHKANISYYWNYENCPNDGYYWLDDIEYGTKITFIPKNPQRDGYDFLGWFKEESCENEWNFDIDTIPSALKDENDELIYQETILYAKWTESLDNQ